MLVVALGFFGCQSRDDQEQSLATQSAAVTGDVRIDGDSTVCFTDSNNVSVCDDGIVSTGQSVNTLEGIIGTTGFLTTPIGSCSATLVGRRQILTARHCFAAGISLSSSPGCSIKFPQSGSSFSCSKFLYVGSYIPSSFDKAMRGDDLVLLELTKSVPTTVVGKPAPVWMGRMNDALDRAQSVWQIGFGTPNVSKRQYGRVNNLSFQFSPCSGPIQIGCQPTPILVSWNGDAISPQSGDSGGPVVVNVDGTFFVVGVESGFNWPDEVRAAVSNVSSRIGTLVGNDLDDDGFDDGNEDNCPPPSV